MRLRLINLALKTRRPGVAGRLLAGAAKPIGRANGRWRVLCPMKPVFSEDVRALAERATDVSYFGFPGVLLRRFVDVHLADSGAVRDATYHAVVGGTEAQQRIRQDMRQVFRALKQRVRFDAMLVPNFTYVGQQELLWAAREAGVPVVVLYKEGMIPPGKTHFAGAQLLDRREFWATLLLTYNEANRDMLARSGVPGLTVDKIAVTGVPRFDEYLEAWPVARAPERPLHVVLFAFSPGTKASYLVPDTERRSAYVARLNAFHEWCVQAAREEPRMRLTIKTKTWTSARTDALRACGVGDERDLPPNVSIVTSPDAPVLIRQAAVVAGYSSTTLLEGLMLGVPVVTPDLEDILPGEVVDYFDRVPEAVTRVRTFAQLQAALARPAALPFPGPEALHQVLEPLVFRPDGQACARVEREIVSLLKDGDRV